VAEDGIDSKLMKKSKLSGKSNAVAVQKKASLRKKETRIQTPPWEEASQALMLRSVPSRARRKPPVSPNEECNICFCGELQDSCDFASL
jgi:hypothetical protein